MGNDPTPAPPVVPKPQSDPATLGPGEEWDATKGATKAAAAAGVDMAPIEGTGPGGTVTESDVNAHVASGGGKQAFFCLEANHPGANTTRADHFDMSRMFYSTTDEGAPTCPLCRKQVSAIAVDDTSKLPPSLQATADRLAAAERNR